MIESPLTRLSKVIYEFGEALDNYEKYPERELRSYLIEIENTVDTIFSQYRPTSITDMKFRVFDEAIREYESIIKVVKEAMMDRDYNRVKALLPELETTVRMIVRRISIVSSGTIAQIADVAKELELYIGEDVHKLDSRIEELSHTARAILAYLVDSTTKEINLSEIPRKIGLPQKESKKVVSDAVGELLRKVPDMVEVVPDTRLKGMKIRLKR